MPTPKRTVVSDVRAFRALANPVRYRILGHLMAVGPQTASQCGAVVGATASNCSYHLRELSRYGLVERVGGRERDGRERPWRATATGFSYRPPDGASGRARAADRALVHAGIDDEASLAHEAVDRRDDDAPEWHQAESMATYGLRVTPEELLALTTAVDALIRPYISLTRDDPPPDARAVHVTFRAFLRPGTT